MNKICPKCGSYSLVYENGIKCLQRDCGWKYDSYIKSCGIDIECGARSKE
jgi:hypothetical protein